MVDDIEDIKISSKNCAIYNVLVEKTKYQWNDSDLFLEYLRDNFNKYHAHIRTLDGYVGHKVLESNEIIRCLFPKIFEAVSYYLRGKVPSAYSSMREAFESISSLLIKKSANRSTTGFEFGFKARVLKPGVQPLASREDMFHIPFEKRHIVKDQRYSIHGIPSIYLGRSIYDCYMELGKPSLDEFCVSLFCFSQDKENIHNSKPIRLVDLTFADKKHDLWLLLHSAKNDEESYIATLDQLVDDILLWPLVMACSIVCKYPMAPFKQEYIIPQMLYQLCSEKNEFTGIRYYSTKLVGSDRDSLKNAMINYALPAQDVKRSGYCPVLAGHLTLTEPITANRCQDLHIDSKFGYTTTFGLPIISEKCDSLKNDETVLALDKMTMYFDKLLTTFWKEENRTVLGPLKGWPEKQ